MDKKDFFVDIFDKVPIGLLTFDKEFSITFINEAFQNLAEFYNYSLEGLTGQNVLTSTFIFELLKKEIEQLQDGVSFSKQIKAKNVPGRGNISVLLKGTPVFDKNIFEGGILVFEDFKTILDANEESEFKNSHFQQAINKAFDIFIVTDKEGYIKYASGKHLKQQFIDSLKDAHIIKTLNVESSKNVYDAIYEVREKKKSITLDLLSSYENNSFNYRCILQPVFDINKNVISIFFFFFDFTSIINKNDHLKSVIKDLQKYYEFWNKLQSPVFCLDITGKIILWNDEAQNVFNFNRNEVTFKNVWDIISTYNKEYFEELKEDLLKNSFNGNKFPLFKGLRKHIINARHYLIENENNKYIVVYCNDDTENVEAEIELKKSEEKYRNIVNEASEIILNLKPDGTLLFANPIFFNLLGYSEDEENSLNLKELLYDRNDFQFPLEFKDKRTFDLQLKNKAGEKVFFLATFAPVIIGKNSISYYNGFLTDITLKKNTEEDLVIFKTLFDASQDGIALLTANTIKLANSALAEIFGYNNSDELLNMSFIDFVDIEEKEEIADEILRIQNKIKEKSSLEFTGIHKNGTRFYCSVMFSPLKKNGTIFVNALVKDITEIKKASKALKDSEEKYRNLTENIDDSLYTLEKGIAFFRPIFYSSSIIKITGYTSDEFISDTKLLFKIIHPEDIQYFRQKIKILLKSSIQNSEELEFRIFNKDNSLVWVRDKINVIRDNEGAAIKIYGLLSDITLRKKAEEELKITTENLLKQNNTKDKFISIVSHDLRTPFSSILGFTDLLLTDDELTETEQKQYVSFIKDSAKSMLNLVNSLLDWTRIQTGRIKFEPSKIILNQVIDEVITSLKGAAIQKNINLYSEINNDVIVYADNNLLFQAISNLVSNSIKFTPANGTINISGSPSIKKRFYEISVKDNGVGILPENIENLFVVDKKFTSEGTQGEKGTGLGLSLVKDIIEKHGGEISVESAPGKGSDFIFTIPVNAPNILLLDDNKTENILYSKLIKKIAPDYNVDLVFNSSEGYNYILNTPPAIIICEHKIDSTTGYDLIKKLQKSEIKNIPAFIILTSEDVKNIEDEYKSLDVEYIFKKPVNLTLFKQAFEKSLKKRK